MGSINEIMAWAEKHPLPAGAITFGLGLLVLWWMGVIGSSGTAADQTNSAAQQTQQNLATAYYAAEAANATAGTQLQLATVQADAATNINQFNDQAAVAINAAQQQTQQLGVTTEGQVANTEYNDMLQANNVNSQYAYNTAVATGQAANYNTLLSTTIPYELALTGNSNLYGNFAGTTYGLNTGGLSPVYGLGYPVQGPLLTQV
jgi:hypothetical protein